MIRLVPASEKCRFAREIDAMFRSRANTFSDRLGWEVVVKNGYEQDRFDELDPLYVISVDPESGEYWGSLRLLPTTGPNMLRDVFPQLLGEEAQVADATIWESSRICATTCSDQPERMKNWLNYALCELLLGVGEVAIPVGLNNIVSVFDARMLRVLRGTGCNLTIIGAPQRIGKVMSYAALFDVGPGALENFKEYLGVDRSVLAPDANEYISTLAQKYTCDSYAA
ncbi:MAG: acyl-homoserine-lactone synthase [Roseiarcus sp.]